MIYTRYNLSTPSFCCIPIACNISLKIIDRENYPCKIIRGLETNNFEGILHLRSRLGFCCIVFVCVCVWHFYFNFVRSLNCKPFQVADYMFGCHMLCTSMKHADIFVTALNVCPQIFFTPMPASQFFTIWRAPVFDAVCAYPALAGECNGSCRLAMPVHPLAHTEWNPTPTHNFGHECPLSCWF